MTLKSTTDYSIFKKVLGNRTVNAKKVEGLIESMKTYNLTQAKPILVNSKFEILDGQHRLEACKALQIAVYYVQMDLPDSVMILLNKNQSNWTIEEYLNYYAEIGNENYKKLVSFCKEMKISFGLFLAFCGSHRKNIKKLATEGDFVFPSDEKIDRIRYKISLIKEFISFLIIEGIERSKISYFSSFSFWEALANVPDEINFSKFIDNLKRMISVLKPAQGYKGYLLQFQAFGLYE